MTRQKKTQSNAKQLNIFESTQLEKEMELEFEDIDLDALTDEDLGLDGEDGDRTIETAQELLTLKLLREAIKKNNSDDPVMADFAQYVLPNLLRVAIGVTAKGGKFFDEIDRRRAAEGKGKVRRDNAGDQSLNTHLLNGLFPANLIEKRLEKLDTTIRRVVKEFERRIAIAGFILHDFEKFNYDLFSKMPEKYKVACRDFNTDIRSLSPEEHREIFEIIVPELELDRFLFPNTPKQWRDYLDDLLYVAYNAQTLNDTNLNLSEDGLNPTLGDRTLKSLAKLTCLADRLASIVKHPQDALHNSLGSVLHELSNGQLKFTYHSIAENRGVLTNVVNNAVMEAHTDLNTDGKRHYEPLLYLPTGVIYLSDRDAIPISPEGLPDRVVATIKTLCSSQLRQRQTGFGRDGKGMKYADYYRQFFDDRDLMEVALDATLRILKPTKTSVAKSRSENLLKFQLKDVLSAQYDFKFEDDIRIDQLAEFGDVVTRKIWGDRLAQIEILRKTNKKLPPPPDLDLVAEVTQFWQLDIIAPLRQIQRINERHKELKIKGNTGGVPYEWYYLAAQYLKQHPGQEDIRPIADKLIEFVSGKITEAIAPYKVADGWEDMRQWVKQVVMLPNQELAEKTDEKTGQKTDIFLKELANYNAAKKDGRGRQLICSLSHSAYTVTEQMESAVLFTPQVYTNKQKLQGSNAKRNISSIAGTEMMLRQILMNQTQAVGKRFEDGKYRYLYFYPTYYFTPETNTFLQKAYINIAQTRFDASIRSHFVSKELQADFGRDRYQTVDTFLMDEDLQNKKNLPYNDKNKKQDRTFKLSYPEDKPLTFYFMAMPPGRDPTDTESWVMPAWLAFAFPMILDVKTVVSESPIPPYRDGAEFEETVFLDSAPQAFRVLTGGDRFRLDYILEGWKDSNGKEYPAPLNVLTAAYSIHLDVNAKRGKSGYDANWGKLSELARNLETSPLYVFHYLNQWTRGKDADVPSISRIKLYTYDFYPCFDPYVQFNSHTEELSMTKESPLNHPKQLTDLYRKFYRANRRYNPKANAVLKPIDIASETILKAESSVFYGETLVAVVAAEVCKLMDRVHSSTAEGRWQIKEREQERQAVLDFARYFVTDVFEGAFKGDRARLAGRQINLIRDTCEFLYRLEQDQENQQNKANDEPSETSED
ncbi:MULTISPECIES: type I-D CRISPR-associated protein Cas10d/Csc3 [Spirulina sp. CCY15215]|uniref:type I-D CRISPR-associated protein Cas10d/Csc3 n=1 Tax=Spirulina sp. CCY15215 TaxID=2767591 RepID=UPI0019502EA4|nr:type I-D CRISPR-associated protein Cas10d/Csc3 [Spirulina major]